MDKVLITGSTGFTGSHLARKLLAEGYDVRILVRSDKTITRLELTGAEVCIGDVTDKESVEKAVKGCGAVYHIAALYRKASVPDSAFWDVNLTGTENLLEAALKYDVNRFVHCSTIGVHGGVSNPPANEDSPFHPGDIYQITKVAGEKAALRFQKEHGLPVTVVRPAGIYGPGDTRWLKLFKGIARRKFVMLGSGETFIHMVYISDLVDAFRLAADSPVSVGNVYIAGGERYVSLNELAETIAKVVGVPAPKLHIPVKPVRILSGICEDLCKVIHIEPPIYRRRIDFFVKNRAFDITKAKTELGFAPKIDVQEGIALTARWYKEQGLL